ncbi:MAG: FlgO family outer membrane protein [Bacteroidota bacterium]
MSKSIIVFFALSFNLIVSVHAQDFDKIIASTADTLSKKIISSERKKVAITDFVNLDESITQLGTFLSEEVSSELSNLTDNQTKFRILERSKLNQILEEKNLIQSTDGSKMAKELGKLSVADALIFATITDFNGYYRVVMKLLDTKTGDALSSYKINLVKTPSLENLNQNNIKKSSIVEPKVAPVVYTAPEPPLSRTGDFCFSNKGTWPHYNVKITIFKIKSDDIEKVINVSNDEKTCAYEMPVGIHKVELVWLSNSNEVKTEVKEIKVTSDKPGNVEYIYSF